MTDDLAVSCSCGALRGSVAPDARDKPSHVVCYCDDCQAFAHALGRAADVLDDHAGTDIYQVSPARLRFNEGSANLACMRLSEKGILRWYSACCDTPIGNTLAMASFPFVGIVTACLKVPGGQTLDDVIGPVTARVHGRFARGDLGDLDVSMRAPLPLMLKTLAAVALRRLRVEHRHSPFFEPKTGAPVAVPDTLTPERREALRAECDAAR